ncbi:MAG TPA: cell surface protein SprA, partial [Bacteroidales bacterium]|nr:cell surface protein SprA [Bacteroidales bacterium]
PSVQAMVNEFDNNNAARPFQDVGYDGLRNEDEALFYDIDYIQKLAELYGPASEAYQKALEDPSNDDYHYFRGSDYDDDPKYSSLLERYKMYNGPDGNSPTDAMNPEPYPTVATRNPDVEDINVDNTLSESERYFQYEIDLKPDQMEVGKNYITDKYTPPPQQLANGERRSVTWYQFKIPVRNPDKVVGNIQDFKSIRFLRMFMKDFSEPVILRFATLELVRGEWRKYNQAMLEDGEYVVQEDESTFDISAVNIEENGQRDPIPYVLPPGIERERLVGTTTVNQQNEQSMVLEVCDLEDGFARAAYKTTDFDFRQYGRLKMFVHAEKSNIEDNYKTGELTAFIRLGADFTENYYEYEVPLEFTDWGTGNRQDIWPEANEIDLLLSKLTDAKLRRQELRNQGNTDITNSMTFVVNDGKNRITIKGVPSLSDVKTIMIGVRNPKKTSFDDADDGLEKCAEIWVNELRLTGFDENSGWAATTRIRANLADFGTVTLAGSHSTPGFGSIEENVNERQKENSTQLAFSTNLELGKFFPEESGIKIPMHFDYSESRLRPEYDPMNPDIRLKEMLDSTPESAQDSILKRSEDLTVRKNINFMNVRKDKVGGGTGKPAPWDIENFNVSYAYSEISRRNIDIEYDITKQYQGGLGYNFNTNPEPVTPLKSVSFLQGEWLKPLREFNFNYLPQMFSFRTEMNREYNERLLRSKSIGDVKLDPTYLKNWDWRRIYSLQYNLTRSIKIDYSANANAFIDEPPGVIDRDADNYSAIQDTIKQELFNFGTIDRYTQTLNATYKVPIDKIPLFDWTSLQARYSANYSWQASAQSVQERLGNSIENSNNIQLNGNFRLSKLYDKIGYLEELGKSSRSRSRRGGPGGRGNPGSRSQQQQEEQEQDSTKKNQIFKKILDNTLMILTGVKDASVNYNETNGTLLPGFMPEPTMVGNRLNDMAPGLGFVFGSQKDIRYKAARNGWITYDTLLNNPYMTKQNKNFTYRVRIEPYRDFRIELTGNQTESLSQTSYFKAGADSTFASFSPQESGSFSTSIISWPTAFEKFNPDNFSQAFEDLKEYRFEVAQRLSEENPFSQTGQTDSLGFPDGYGSTSQQVLIPAFLAAYTGDSPGSIGLNPFPKIPLPNWRVSFDGLTEISWIREYLKSVSITHAYRSSYNVGSYVSNINYVEDGGHSVARNQADDFYAEREIGIVTISEQFSPLIGVDATLHNSLMARFEMKKSRNLSLSFTNNQLTEVKSNEIVIGMGYRIKDIEFFIKSLTSSNNQRSRTSSDLNIKIDLSIKNNKTILRRVDEDIAQISAGRKMFTLNGSADYSVSQRFNLRFYFNKNVNNPYISTQFPTSNTEGGISMTFTLQ